MANIKSQEKRIIQDERNRQRSMNIRTRMRTLMKQARLATEAKEAQAEAQVRAAISAIDRAVSKGVLHRNAAARKKSQLMSHGAGR
jgi:small subunit ribosomal protein S20